MMYRKGQGVPKDYEQAYAWLNLSASSGILEATKQRETLEQKMTAEQIAMAQRLSKQITQEILQRKSIKK